jgi:hypothetical protein
MTTIRTNRDMLEAEAHRLKKAGYEIIAIETYIYPQATYTDVIWGRTKVPAPITDADIPF